MSAKPSAHDEEDDLDDLDDIVDQFDTSPVPQPKAPPPTATVETPSKASSSFIDGPTNESSSSPCFEDEFAKQLADDMERLMLELSSTNPSLASTSDQERAAAWEKMLVEGMNGASAGEPSSSSAGSPIGPSPPPNSAAPIDGDAFQKSIQQAMDRLKSSDSSLQSDASSSANSGNDPLEALLSQLGGAAGLEENESALQGILEDMMKQLMTKELLYEPLKELSEKFPTYIAENTSKMSEEEKSRYEKQSTCASKVIAIFDDPNYKDGDPVKGAQLATLMNEMQSYGSPPKEIMGPLPPELEFGEDGMPKLPGDCTIS